MAVRAVCYRGTDPRVALVGLKAEVVVANALLLLTRRNLELNTNKLESVREKMRGRKRFVIWTYDRF